jgi:hypothetical protein
MPAKGEVDYYHYRVAQHDGINGEVKHEAFGLSKTKDVSELLCVYPDCRERARVYVDIFVEAPADFPEGAKTIPYNDRRMLPAKRTQVCDKHARRRFIPAIIPEFTFTFESGIPKDSTPFDDETLGEPDRDTTKRLFDEFG